MSSLQAKFAAITLCAVAALCGCGGSAPVATQKPATVAPNTAALAGNWLLYGSLPISPIITFGTAVPPKGMAVSIDVIGTTAIATATLESQCANGTPFGATYNNIIVGTVASDGAFTLSTPNVTGATLPVLTISGMVPTSARAAWSGSYNFNVNGLGCVANDSGIFQATPVQDVTGIYAGTATFPGTGNISVSASLQQGASSANGVVSPAVSRQTLSGSLQVTGISCFSKGTLSTGLLEGTNASMSFVMDDGSKLTMTGYLLSADASKISVPVLIVQNGNCAGLYSARSGPLVLQR